VRPFNLVKIYQGSEINAAFIFQEPGKFPANHVASCSRRHFSLPLQSLHHLSPIYASAIINRIVFTFVWAYTMVLPYFQYAMTFEELEFPETANYEQPLLRKADEWESCDVTFNVGDVKVQCTEARKNTE
jgi:hypothetical protein